MPDAEVSIYAVFEETAADPQAPVPQTRQTPNQNGTGKSVGIGASFAMTLADDTVNAYIGENRSVKAGALEVKAEQNGSVKTASVSGSDPLTTGDPNSAAANSTSGTNTQGTNTQGPGSQTSNQSSASQSSKPKDISLDASVALNILDNTVTAKVAQTAQVVTTGADVLALPADVKKSSESGNQEGSQDTATGEDAAAGEEEDNSLKYNFLVLSRENAASQVKASGFSMGSSTAVGAAVALNIVNSDVKASFEGTGDVNGGALVQAKSHSEDVSEARWRRQSAQMSRDILTSSRRARRQPSRTRTNLPAANSSVLRTARIVTRIIIRTITRIITRTTAARTMAARATTARTIPPRRSTKRSMTRRILTRRIRTRPATASPFLPTS